MAAIKGEVHFGQYLQQWRREREIPLEAVSRSTRISLSSLRLIESEDLVNLPAPLYVKSFLKSYAEAIGADPQDAIKRYENNLELHKRNEQVQPQPRMSQSQWPRLILAVILFAMVIFATLYMAGWINRAPDQKPHTSTQSEPGQKPVAEPAEPAVAVPEGPPAGTPDYQAPQAVEHESMSESQPEDQLPAEPAQETETASPPLEPSPPAGTKDVLQLEMAAVEPTWIKAIADGQAPHVFTLKPDERVTLEAKDQFNLLIGNAGGIRLFLNGKEIYVPGKSGQVVTLQLPR
jgi:cytoskeleton protein RodZ